MNLIFNDVTLKPFGADSDSGISSEYLAELSKTLGHNIYPIRNIIHDTTTYPIEDLKTANRYNVDSALYLRDDKYSIIYLPFSQWVNEASLTNVETGEEIRGFVAFTISHYSNSDPFYMGIKIIPNKGELPPTALYDLTLWYFGE